MRSIRYYTAARQPGLRPRGLRRSRIRRQKLINLSSTVTGRVRPQKFSGQVGHSTDSEGEFNYQPWRNKKVNLVEIT